MSEFFNKQFSFTTMKLFCLSHGLICYWWVTNFFFGGVLLGFFKEHIHPGRNQAIWLLTDCFRLPEKHAGI